MTVEKVVRGSLIYFISISFPNLSVEIGVSSCPHLEHPQRVIFTAHSYIVVQELHLRICRSVLRRYLIASEAIEECESEHYAALSEGKEVGLPPQILHFTIEDVLASKGARFWVL